MSYAIYVITPLLLSNYFPSISKISNSLNYNYHLDNFGRIKGNKKRPELSKGVYEFLAPKKYEHKEITKEKLIFLIETSHYTKTVGIII